jgi:hypothetical protein
VWPGNNLLLTLCYFCPLTAEKLSVPILFLHLGSSDRTTGCPFSFCWRSVQFFSLRRKQITHPWFLHVLLYHFQHKELSLVVKLSSQLLQQSPQWYGSPATFITTSTVPQHTIHRTKILPKGSLKMVATISRHLMQISFPIIC